MSRARWRGSRLARASILRGRGPWLPGSARLCCVAVAAIVLTSAAPARAEVWLGAFAGVPGDGSGVPVRERHLPVGLITRVPLGWRPAALDTAITGGLGIPIAGLGVSAWAGLEVRRPVTRWLALAATPGLRAGFVGPGYYARHSDVFVGNDYIHAGPWTVAPRLALGLAAAAGARVELFAEAFAELPVSPSVELLGGGALGVRVRL